MKVCVSMEFSYYDSSSFLTGLPVGIMPCLLVSFVQETHTFPAFENFEKHDGNFVIPAVFLPVSRTGNLKFYIVLGPTPVTRNPELLPPPHPHGDQPDLRKSQPGPCEDAKRRTGSIE